MSARSLLQPIEGQFAAAIAGRWQPKSIELGDVGGAFWALDGERVVLSSDLDVAEAVHPREPQTGAPPLDRWRRALMSAIEAVVSFELAQATGVMPDVSAWWWAGFAAYEADRLAPGLGLAGPDLALAWSTGDLGVCPRAGAAVMTALAGRGEVPEARVKAIVAGHAVEPAEWLSLAAWMSASDGLFTKLSAPVPRRPAVDIPLTLSRWSFARLEVPAHPRGGRVVVSGPGAVSSAWALGGQSLVAVAASAEGESTFTPTVGGPVGTWSVRSSAGFSQVFGARGMDFRFRASGGFDVVLADAFVGPVHAIGEAERYGTTGTAEGSWRVVGEQRLRLGEIRTQSVTMHGRSRQDPKLPSEPYGMAPMLRAMGETEWRWELDGAALRMFGQMMGGAVEIRLERTDA